VERHIAFTAIDPGLCTEVVDFQLIGEPREVSHSVRSTRKAGVSVYREVLGAWAGVLKRVFSRHACLRFCHPGAQA